MALFVDIEKKLGNFHLKVNFKAENEILSILGASGCGKSMTLKCIAGIEKPDRGRIVMDGVTLFDSEKKINLPPQKRRVGYLFQQYALFPNMTVEQNIACGVREKEKREELVASMIEKMNLVGIEKKKPGELSGGQQQRVALARILVNEPEVLLLDEPFSALDSHLRFQLEREVHAIIKKFGKTVILVSHDRDEVFRLSDSLAIMHDGKIEAIGEKKAVFQNPKTRNGAVLTGCKNVSNAKMQEDGTISAEDWGLKLHVKTYNEAETGIWKNKMQKVKFAGIRMHDIAFVSEFCQKDKEDESIKNEENIRENYILCDVKDVIENPFSYTVRVCPKGKKTKKLIGVELEKSIWEERRADAITICIPPEKILLLEE